MGRMDFAFSVQEVLDEASISPFSLSEGVMFLRVVSLSVLGSLASLVCASEVDGAV